MDWREELRAEFDDLTESPIEGMLLSAIVMLQGLEQFPGCGSTPLIVDRIEPQHKEGNFSIDIALLYKNDIKLAVECDGHDFHEKTKEQAAHDKSRKRYLVSKGWTVIEFTGSEIYKNPFECARQVRDLVFNLHHERFVRESA